MQMPRHPGREQPEKPATAVPGRARKSLPSPKGAAPNLCQLLFVFLVLSFLSMCFQENEKSGFLHDSS